METRPPFVMVPIEKQCKLEVFHSLLNSGWEGGADPKSDVKAGKRKKYKIVDHSLERPVSYLLAMHESEKIFEKKGDIKSIWHNGPNNYYNCLLKLEDLSCLQTASRAWPDKRFAELLRGRGVVTEREDEVDAGDAGVRACMNTIGLHMHEARSTRFVGP